MTQQHATVHSDEALSWVKLQVGLPTPLEDQPQVLQVFLPTLTEHSKIIHKHLKKMLHEVMEYVPQYHLKCSGCIAQPKMHPPKGIGTPISNKGGIDLVAEPNVGLMVSCHPIQE